MVQKQKNNNIWVFSVPFQGRIVLCISKKKKKKKKKNQVSFSQLFGNRYQAKPYPELAKKLYYFMKFADHYAN